MVSTRYRFVTLAYWIVVFSILTAGCATPTPDLVEVPFTVVVTATPLEETTAPAQTLEVFPTTPAPPTPTLEVATFIPAPSAPSPTATPVPPSEP